MAGIENVRGWSAQDLVEKAVSLHNAIKGPTCHGLNDPVLLETILDELERRGYTVVEGEDLEITK